jgi:hypothetical protein
MKALSLTQPMAWAIFHGKDIENRRWATKYRGRFIIHASKLFKIEYWNWIAENDNRLGLTLPFSRFDFIYGALIGEVDLVDCVKGHGSGWALPDQYNFVLANPIPYDKPIPCKGKLGFFEPGFESLKG